MTSPTIPSRPSVGLEPEPRQRPARRRLWTVVAGVEVLIAVLAVIFDHTVPTLLLLCVASLGLLVRREGFATLGFHRIAHFWRLAGRILVLTAGWTVLQLALFFPLLEHITGRKQDVSDFNGLEGNAGRLMVLLALSWTLAAVGEELVFRGWIPTRVADVFGTEAPGVILAVLGASALFALIHTEQGAIGVAATFLDALFFSALRLRYRSTWAPVMAHGFNNTIGLVAFFLVGPVTGWW